MSNRPDLKHLVPAPDTFRTLPHSLEAEQGLLGSMLLAPAEVMDNCVGVIKADAFYHPSHQIIFSLLVELWDKQMPADSVTLTQALRGRKQLEAVGGPAYVSSLIDFTPTAANAGYYLDIVKEKHTLRRIIATCTDCASRAYDSGADAKQLQDEFESAALTVADASGRDQTHGDDPRAGTLRALESIERIYVGRQDDVSLQTGVVPLDRMIGGLGNSQVILLAARPSVGKSALALQIAEAIAIDRGEPVGLFTLEMTEEQQRRRLLLARAGLDVERLREKLVPEAAFARLTAAGEQVAAAPLYMDDTRGLSIAELRARARRWHRQHGLKLLVVDYLQLLRSDTRQAQGSREREVAQISEGLKTLARELEIPVLALSQLSRDGAKANRLPRLEDLRESGTLEQDADTVLLLHRSWINPEDEDEQPELSSEATLTVAKQREGPVGSFRLAFLPERCRFEQRVRRDA